ncbi:hypothetical protein PYCCODRAFT_1442761 [Trametes coccinea BRFM310]|uniref:DUF2415 domain-containing protein n=1 Tax=Trametes coccinea (strain BRFM310) TaxID=1353009 RepID=A0A1Y2J378_TRAC3|nr:hypothetical protein PYCCODRAFT_1442761 [Trametes coccinea BRFM310]
MARGLSSLLSSSEPCTVVPTNVTIGHVQLRDVVICPHEKGIVTYPRNFSIVEHDILNLHSSPRRLVDLTFTPNTISSLILPDTNDTLLAAGGQEAELHLSYYQSTDSCPSPSTPSPSSIRSAPRGFGRKLWESKYILEHAASINNSVMLTSMSFSRSNESAAEPRILVSNNDRTVKFYDIAVRRGKVENDYEPRLLDIGILRLDVPINHSSIAPDGRTLLCVGDSPDVYLHRITGGSKITFTPIAKLSLSAYIQESHVGGLTPVSSIPASFSTSFSADGSKFAVASQEGVVVVWDVRSTKPLKVFHTDKSRAGSPFSASPTRGTMSNMPGVWPSPYDLPWDWSRGGTRAPGWGVRSVKFSPPGVGREVMTFTEHTSLLHVVDARTFETEEIVRMPNLDSPAYYPSAPARPRSTSPVSRSSATVRSSSSAETLPSDPRRIVLFSGALEDTFRIPTSDNSSSTASGWRTRQRSRRPHRDLSPDDDPDNIVVIPQLGDRDIENNVRLLLAGRRLNSRTTLLGADADPREPLEGAADGAREGEEMDVDELESDCLSSHAPSRSGSPAPASQLSLQSSGTRPLELLRSRPTLLARRESNGPYAARWAPTSAAPSASSSSRRHRRGLGQTLGDESPEEEQDLAGMCFDPNGAFVYVAAQKGIAEWRVRGAEQRWWTEPEWA